MYKRMFLKKRNEKNLARRTEKRRLIKLRRTREIEYNASLKKTATYNVRTQRHEFKAPLIFSFISNAEETNRFFEDVLNFICNRKNYGKEIFIDISNIKELTIDALMYLLAIINNMDENLKSKYSIGGNYPSDQRVKKMFMESGFFKYVRHRGREPITQSTDSVKIVSGTNNDPSIAKQIADFVIEKAKVTKKETHFIYVMMSEMMANTFKHAYNKNNRLLPNWYCYVNCDKDDRINFTFMDTGEGIPSTVHKNFSEKLDLLKIKSEDQYVISALQGDFRTATKETNRGKGLPRIKDICQSGQIENLKIITNRAEVSVFTDNYESNLIDKPLMGTLYYWQVDIKKLKGETI